jgi:hypothetical protein
LVIFAVGCGSKSPETAPPTTGGVSKAPEKPVVASVPDGWQTVKTATFSIALPKDWKLVDLSSADFEKAISSMELPGGDAMKKQVIEMGRMGGFKLYAVGPQIKDGFAENLNVNVVASGGADLKTISDANEKMLATAAKNVKSSIESNPDRIVMTASMKTPGPNGVDYATHAEMLPHGSELYTFTFSSAPSAISRVEGIAKDAVQTIKFN